MKRWSLEVTFEEGRAHLGIETQRQWSDRAIERSTPLLFGLYSLVTLFGQTLHPNGQIPVAQAAWYCKQTTTFRDVLALVWRHLWGQGTFPTSPTDPGVVLVPRSTLERLSLAGFYLLPMAVRSWAPRGQTPVLRVKLTRDHLSAISGTQ
jgi:hypothetical protein